MAQNFIKKNYSSLFKEGCRVLRRAFPSSVMTDEELEDLVQDKLTKLMFKKIADLDENLPGFDPKKARNIVFLSLKNVGIDELRKSRKKVNKFYSTLSDTERQEYEKITANRINIENLIKYDRKDLKDLYDNGYIPGWVFRRIRAYQNNRVIHHIMTTLKDEDLAIFLRFIAYKLENEKLPISTIAKYISDDPEMINMTGRKKGHAAYAVRINSLIEKINPIPR